VIPVAVVTVDRAEGPVNPRIAEKAKHLHELGMSDRAIARAVGVSDKTVAKSVALMTLQDSLDERPRPRF
jgi:hypothetical protein